MPVFFCSLAASAFSRYIREWPADVSMYFFGQWDCANPSRPKPSICTDTQTGWDFLSYAYGPLHYSTVPQPVHFISHGQHRADKEEGGTDVKVHDQMFSSCPVFTNIRSGSIASAECLLIALPGIDSSNFNLRNRSS